MVSYLAEKGPRVLANGFHIIPIQPGQKYPSIKGWQSVDNTEAQLNRWRLNGRANHGVGILTRLTPFADLDISHRTTLKTLLDRITIKIGFAPVRVGNAPKRGLLFKLKGDPFRKINSREYRDPDGNKAKVEILADGEQFVAFHIHPDTHKPYRWLYGESPETVTVDRLPELTAEEGRWIVDTFHELMEAEGWPAWSGPQSQSVATRSYRAPENPADDPLGLDGAPLGLTDDELRAKVEIIPNDDAPYEGPGLTWFNMLAAVHHETDGTEVGRDIALDWSEKSGRHEINRFNKTWNSFGEGERRPVTARLILLLAKEYEPIVFADKLARSQTVKEWQEIAKAISKLDRLTSFEREEYALAVKEAGRRITGHVVSIKIARAMVRPTPAELGDFTLNEDGVALAFAERYKTELRFCATTGRWHQWSGYHWKVEKTKLAFDWARTTCRDLRSDDPASEAALSRAAAAEAVEKFARADRAFAVEATIWDTDPWLLGTPDGTVDLRTGKLRQAQQEDYITKITKIGPGTGEAKRWLKYLDEVTDGNSGLTDYLQLVSGYFLTGDTREQNLVFIHGPGGNGKGVFIHTLEYIFNDYATTASMDTFAENNGFSRHPTDIAALDGYRLVITSEVAEGQSWDEVRIKALTGGDRVSARFMRQDQFLFVPSFKIVVVGNNAPIIRTVDDAIKRRFQMAPFNFKPPIKNLQLESELRAEAPQILSWMIEGAFRWQKDGLILPDIVTKTTEDYFSEQDIIGQWLDGYTEKGNFTTATTDLKASYDLISGSEGGRLRRSSMAFADALARRGYERVRNVYDSSGIRGRGFKGLRLSERDVNGDL